MHMVIVFLLIIVPFLYELSYSATILVDGVSQWPNPTVHVGDSVIFKDKYEEYKLYIFKNQRAFTLCNFTQATLLTNSNSNSFTWYPSRPGLYYFTFSNASLKCCNAQFSQKLIIKVSLPPPTPVAPPIPAPVSGGEVSSSPAYPWPFHPRESASSPVPAPAPAPSNSGGGTKSPMTMPTVDKGGSGNMPFINSNPAVPLPTDEVDSATIRPFSASAAHHQQVAVGYFGAHMTLFCVILLLLL